VVILTTRAHSSAGASAVRAWLRDQGLVDWREITITDRKPPATLYVDDRAWRFGGIFPTAAEISGFRPWRAG